MNTPRSTPRKSKDTYAWIDPDSDEEVGAARSQTALTLSTPGPSARTPRDSKKRRFPHFPTTPMCFGIGVTPLQRTPPTPVSLSRPKPRPRGSAAANPPSNQPEAGPSRLHRDALDLPGASAQDLRDQDLRDIPSAPATHWHAPFHGEEIAVPAYTDEAHIPMSQPDVQKSILDFIATPFNWEDVASARPSQARVPGFKKGVYLAPHQIRSRAWMKAREDPGKKHFGGILADDMGLGKSRQVIVRVKDGKSENKGIKNIKRRPTLIVCPKSLVHQWHNEFEKTTDKLGVYCYYGPKRFFTDLNELTKYDVVITSYDTLKAEHDRYGRQARNEGASAGVDASAGVEPVAASAAPFIDDDAAESEFQSSSDDEMGLTTDDETSASESGARATLHGRPFIYKNGKKVDNKKDPKGGREGYKDALYRVDWLRIVLDEASDIKNHETQRALACCDLRGLYRWCLTGTPLQNGIMDLYSYFKFLRIRPFLDYKYFTEVIAKPLQDAAGAKAAFKRVHLVLSRVMIRRLKNQVIDGKKVLNLKDPKSHIVLCRFSDPERAFYAKLEEHVGNMLHFLFPDQEAKKDIRYRNCMYVLLLRLRQACDHFSLLFKSFKLDEAAIITSTDDHSVIAAVADSVVNTAASIEDTKLRCLLCSIRLTPYDPREGYCLKCTQSALLGLYANLKGNPSAKTEAISHLLDVIHERGPEKTIIYSQFTTMLDSIQAVLKEKKVEYVRYDGKMSTYARDRAIESITYNINVSVILISLMAGGTGLDLTCCNVILVDPWWNPAVEEQAFGRVHRIGQQKQVYVYKLVVDNTVEQRILALQDRKRALANAAISNEGIQEAAKMTNDDLYALFRGQGEVREHDQHQHANSSASQS